MIGAPARPASPPRSPGPRWSSESPSVAWRPPRRWPTRPPGSCRRYPVAEAADERRQGAIRDRHARDVQRGHAVRQRFLQQRVLRVGQAVEVDARTQDRHRAARAWVAVEDRAGMSQAGVGDVELRRPFPAQIGECRAERRIPGAAVDDGACRTRPAQRCDRERRCGALPCLVRESGRHDGAPQKRTHLHVSHAARVRPQMAAGQFMRRISQGPAIHPPNPPGSGGANRHGDRGPKAPCTQQAASTTICTRSRPLYRSRLRR